MASTGCWDYGSAKAPSPSVPELLTLADLCSTAAGGPDCPSAYPGAAFTEIVTQPFCLGDWPYLQCRASGSQASIPEFLLLLSRPLGWEGNCISRELAIAP